MRSRRHYTNRPGAVIPLIALLLIPLLAMMAFAIDIGYSVETRAELVNATDAAALAGVQQLIKPFQQWRTASSSSQTTLLANATTLAKATVAAVAGSNSSGGVSLQVVAADVDVGYTDGSGTYYSGNAGKIPAATFPNTVVVTLRRDNTSPPNSNGELPLFFGRALGKSSVALTASATAVAYEGVITNIKSGPGNGDLLPVATDQTQWTDFYKNGSKSQYADPNAPSGTGWLQIYPGGTDSINGKQYSSMNGLLSLNGTKSAADSYYSGATGWIQGGPSSGDISSLSTAGQLPLPSSGAGQTWSSGPGLKSTEITDFQALITTPPTLRLLPLYDPTSSSTTGTGNGTYQITYFVPVYVAYAQNTGSNMDIAIIPANGSPITDPTIVVSNVAPMGSSTTSQQYVVPVAAKLTQ
jgi:Flp pilus assembly protein TadG